MSRTYASAVTIQDALESMRHTDDCIAEIAALLKRLNKVKSQLIAQKEYIDRAIFDARSTVYYHKTHTTSIISPNRSVDYRVKLYKHKNIIGRLYNLDHSDDDIIDEPSNTLEEKEAESRAVMRKKILHRGYKLETNDYVPIFQNDQILSNPNSEEVDSNNVFNGLDIVGVKQFFIGVNAILTHPNNISETLRPTPYFYRHLVDWNNALYYPEPNTTILPAGVYFKNVDNMSFTENNPCMRAATPASTTHSPPTWIIDNDDESGTAALKKLVKNYSHLWDVTDMVDSTWDFTVTFKTSEIDRPYELIKTVSNKREFYSYSKWIVRKSPSLLYNDNQNRADRYYTPGLKHALSTGILKGLLMQGNENITGQEASHAIKAAISYDTLDYTTDTGSFKKIRGFGLD